MPRGDTTHGEQDPSTSIVSHQSAPQGCLYSQPPSQVTLASIELAKQISKQNQKKKQNPKPQERKVPTVTIPVNRSPKDFPLRDPKALQLSLQCSEETAQLDFARYDVHLDDFFFKISFRYSQGSDSISSPEAKVAGGENYGTWVSQERSSSPAALSEPSPQPLYLDLKVTDQQYTQQRNRGGGNFSHMNTVKSSTLTLNRDKASLKENFILKNGCFHV